MITAEISTAITRTRITLTCQNFDWIDCLAGCEERWGPGGREVDGRRVTLWDPSVVLVQTQQEACGRWKSILIQHSVLTMQSAQW
jgi:hypothetical protein